MQPRLLLPGIMAFLSGLGLSLQPSTGRAQPADTQPQVIILKFDDVTTSGAQGERPVSSRWQRLADFLTNAKLKGAFGIIGYSLEEDNPAYFKWIKDLDRQGLIEFWNHGYRNRKAEDPHGEFEGSLEEQRAALEETQRLAWERLGIELKVFGPHWSGTNAQTVQALAAIPEIKIWLYGPGQTDKFVLKRVLTLENPIFVPDFARFKERYEQVGRNEPYLTLQGHPDAWDEARWKGFVQIIDYLRGRGGVFMTPSEYYRKVSERR